VSVSLDFVREVAARAGAILAEGAFRAHGAEKKGTSVDLVTEFDRRSEELIVAALAAQFPGDRIVAEEGGGTSGAGNGERRWLIDPLDGTTNFTHGLPFFCVSIGLEVAGRPALGVVAAPALGWTFFGERGQGAWLERASMEPVRLSVSGTATLGDSLLATGFPYDNRTSPRNNFDEFTRLYKQTQGVRRVGAAALDLCMVAAGWMDGYWEMKLKAWDSCAGALFVEEAGGRVTGYRGQPYSADAAEIVATNGHIHQAILNELASS
jgi:myo-inositol-1(or 4)-monophosphatase